MLLDTIHNPPHYTIYPVQPIEITRYLGFCFGNAVKYALRAPYKGGEEDCLKAKKYLQWESEAPQHSLAPQEFNNLACACKKLERFLANSNGDQLWSDIAIVQSAFVERVRDYAYYEDRDLLQYMIQEVDDLGRILRLRDTTCQIYEGLSGLPRPEENDGQG